VKLETNPTPTQEKGLVSIEKKGKQKGMNKIYENDEKWCIPVGGGGRWAGLSV